MPKLQHSSFIQSQEEVESFCLFFKKTLVEEVNHTQSTKVVYLLDNTDYQPLNPIHFFEKLYTNPEIFLLLNYLLQEIEDLKTSQNRLDELFYALAEHLIALNQSVLREVGQIDKIKWSTKVELYKRVCQAKDYLDSCFCEKITLYSLSRLACLSKYHFIRLFKQIFHLSSHQYIIQKRLAYAQSLLKTGSLPVQDICILIGFEDAGAFCRLFKKKFGTSPQDYQEKK